MVFNSKFTVLLAVVSAIGCATANSSTHVANNHPSARPNQPTKTSTVPQRVLLRNPFYQRSPMVWGDAEWSQQVFEIICLFAKQEKTGNSSVKILKADSGTFFVHIPNDCRKHDIRRTGDEGEYYLWSYSMMVDQDGTNDGEANIDEYRRFFGRVIVALAMVDKNIPDGLYKLDALKNDTIMFLEFLAIVKNHLTIDKPEK
jgi:hypothetical protein